MTSHRFRFFVTQVCSVGDVVTLHDADARHLRVIRAGIGELFDVIDGAGTVFEARLSGPATLDLVSQLELDGPGDGIDLVLYAGVLTGQAWDQLVDGAVQAGVSRIVPLIQSSRELATYARRSVRINRVVESAAKQAKRNFLPVVDEPLHYAELPLRLDNTLAIVLDEHGGDSLLDVLHRERPVTAVSIVVGAASGLPRAWVDELVAGSWQRASLGPTILRSELAAAVAVSCVSQLQ